MYLWLFKYSGVCLCVSENLGGVVSFRPLIQSRLTSVSMRIHRWMETKEEEVEQGERADGFLNLL